MLQNSYGNHVEKRVADCLSRHDWVGRASVSLQWLILGAPSQGFGIALAGTDAIRASCAQRVALELRHRLL